jgi:hypothetical protein
MVDYDFMKWWKTALIGTGILLVIVAGIAFAKHQQIVKTVTSPQEEETRDNALGTVCGEITGAGIVIIWVVAYRKRNKQ